MKKIQHVSPSRGDENEISDYSMTIEKRVRSNDDFGFDERTLNELGALLEHVQGLPTPFKERAFVMGALRIGERQQMEIRALRPAA